MSQSCSGWLAAIEDPSLMSTVCTKSKYLLGSKDAPNYHATMNTHKMLLFFGDIQPLEPHSGTRLTRCMQHTNYNVPECRVKMVTDYENVTTQLNVQNAHTQTMCSAYCAMVRQSATMHIAYKSSWRTWSGQPTSQYRPHSPVDRCG